jgi:hypothetical protein
LLQSLEHFSKTDIQEPKAQMYSTDLKDLENIGELQQFDVKLFSILMSCFAKMKV